MAIRFGTSGWRAIFAEEFTFSNVRLVAQAISQHLKTHEEFGLPARGLPARSLPSGKNGSPGKPLGRVVVGYDTRFLSEQFAREAAGVFAANGFHVLLSDSDVPTPVVAHHILKNQALGGLIVTASHNPAEYNGLKWNPYWAGPAPSAVTEDIESHLRALRDQEVRWVDPKTAQKEKKIELADLHPAYVLHLKSLLGVAKIKRAKLKVGVDLQHGSATHYLLPLLSEVGCQVHPLHAERDVLFGGHSSEPAPETLSELAARMRKSSWRLGLSCDGDADRFGILDAKGTWLPPNEILGLLLDHLVRHKGLRGKVVRSVMTSHFVDAVAKHHGLEVRETPVGFKYIGELMREGGYLFGGEESGGLSIQGHAPEKDGILACLLAVELVATTGKTLTQYKQQLYKQVGAFYSQRLNLHLQNLSDVERLQERLRVHPPLDLAGSSVWRIDETDGFKFLLKEGSWLGLRASGTEPVVRLYAEAKNPQKLRRLLEEGKNLLKQKQR
ncbi:MAG: phosphoglucomutase/phosphomannomutase family protein [Elusimicrobia bacterium]|nr:phosphoglucomutase/phosphomannomutase family protein [Elusimicrobiota bacterium]